MAVEPVIRDLRTTWWAFETRERVLFPGDGFAYSHYHEDGHCGLVAEEATSLDLPDVSSTFADLALFWTKFADMNAYCDRLDLLIERLGVKTIAPTHGLPITDVKATVPKVQAGLKAAALMPEFGNQREDAGDRRRGGANGSLTWQLPLERKALPCRLPGADGLRRRRTHAARFCRGKVSATRTANRLAPPATITAVS